MEAPAQGKRIFRFGVFRANSSGELLRKGERVRLQDQPFRLLMVLLERPGEIVSREELRNILWPSNTYVEFDGSLKNTLMKLRVALGDSAENPVFIETIPKRGYRFIASVVEAEDQREEGRNLAFVADTAKTDAARNIAVPNEIYTAGRRTVVTSVALLLLTLAIVVSYHRLTSAGKTSRTPNNTPAPVEQRRSVAVLGFANVSGKNDDAWLSAALAEMISTELSAGNKLRLVSGEDISQLHQTEPWTPADTLSRNTTSRIGLSLGSDLLVLGSYTVIGKDNKERQIRLDVRLQDAPTGNILTEVAETASEGELSQLTSKIGARLRERLELPSTTPSEQTESLASLPSTPIAIKLYALGLERLRDYEYLAARDLLEQSIEEDAKFPLAHAMLSRALLFLGYYEKARSEAKRGMELAASLPASRRMEIEASYYETTGNRAKAAGIYHVLYTMFPDSLDYGLQLAKLQQDSYRPAEGLETIRNLRHLPHPAGDDPRVDLREASLLYLTDIQAADQLVRLAARKALGTGKKLIYARAEQVLCRENAQHVALPAECQTAYEIFLAAGDRGNAAACLELMADGQRQTGHSQEAIPYYKRALQVFDEAGNQEAAGVTLNNLALVFGNEGKWSKAEQMYRRALEHFRVVNDQLNTAVAISNIADIGVLRGRLEEAATLYRQAQAILETSQSQRTEFVHIGYARLSLMRGDLKAARAHLEPQINSLRAYAGSPWELGSALTVMGDLQSTEGDLTNAAKSYEDAVNVLSKANLSTVTPKISLAELPISNGQPQQAETLLRQAIAALEEEKSVSDEVTCYVDLSRVLLAEGRLSDAQQILAHASTLADLSSYPALKFLIDVQRARIAAAEANLSASGRRNVVLSEKSLAAVIESAKRMTLYKLEQEARLALCELEASTDPASARAHAQALEVDASARGFALIARQAKELTDKSP